ncbi:hypothetical protein [Microbacterium sp. LMC-P-041]|uniref:hypothetical protein n=1 Tax=Microbacterium sp. LMC-P-041 TaxID=3040293 RepID=UPI002553D6F8|nr:hypothetical protein [Microbacterium sp. LMC-P-041]
MSVLAIRHGRGGGAAVPRLGARIVAVAVVALGVGALAGCTTEPEPAPTPTAAFANEEEAFAAAEAVYRAYNEALNELDPALPETFEPLFLLASGGLEAADRENFSVMHAEGHIISGDARVASFEGESSSPPYDLVIAAICLDVSAVNVMDANGNSLVAPGRPDMYALSVEFVAGDDRPLTMDSSRRVGDEQCTD